jgi:hypothetical protein
MNQGGATHGSYVLNGVQTREGLMSEIQRHDGAFIVRIWWEPSGIGPDQTQLWRGWAQHVRNGHQISFQSLDALLTFIQQETGAGADIQLPPIGLV